MNFLFEKQAVLYTSKKYDSVYEVLNKKYGIPYSKIFMIALSIGVKRSFKKDRVDRGREFRSNYLTKAEANTCYSILLCDPDSPFYKDITAFENELLYVGARSLLESYAEGGMTILVEELFRKYWDGAILNLSYDGYLVDLAEFTLAQLDKVDF